MSARVVGVSMQSQAYKIGPDLRNPSFYEFWILIYIQIQIQIYYAVLYSLDARRASCMGSLIRPDLVVCWPDDVILCSLSGVLVDRLAGRQQTCRPHLEQLA